MGERILQGKSIAVAIGDLVKKEKLEEELDSFTVREKHLWQLWKLGYELPEMQWQGAKASEGGEHQQSEEDPTNGLGKRKEREEDENGLHREAKKSSRVAKVTALNIETLCEMYRLPKQDRSKVVEEDVRRFRTLYRELLPLMAAMAKVIQAAHNHQRGAQSEKAIAERQAMEIHSTRKAIDAVEKQVKWIMVDASKMVNAIQGQVSLMRGRVSALDDAHPEEEEEMVVEVDSPREEGSSPKSHCDEENKQVEEEVEEEIVHVEQEEEQHTMEHLPLSTTHYPPLAQKDNRSMNGDEQAQDYNVVALEDSNKYDLDKEPSEEHDLSASVPDNQPSYEEDQQEFQTRSQEQQDASEEGPQEHEEYTEEHADEQMDVLENQQQMRRPVDGGNDYHSEEDQIYELPQKEPLLADESNYGQTQAASQEERYSVSHYNDSVNNDRQMASETPYSRTVLDQTWLRPAHQLQTEEQVKQQLVRPRSQELDNEDDKMNYEESTIPTSFKPVEKLQDTRAPAFDLMFDNSQRGIRRQSGAFAFPAVPSKSFNLIKKTGPAASRITSTNKSSVTFEVPEVSTPSTNNQSSQSSTSSEWGRDMVSSAGTGFPNFHTHQSQSFLSPR